MLRLLVITLSLCSVQGLYAQLVVGSKNFPESKLLAEIIAQQIEANTSLEVERKFSLGGTLICFEALRSGEIDIYPEYSGTLGSAILKSEEKSLENLCLELSKKYGLSCGESFGFSNNYVLVTRGAIRISKISDLRKQTRLTLGFSNEFINREDGFKGLNTFYQLELPSPRGLDHGLAYRALFEGTIDITDAYSTDGKLSEYNFNILQDDKGFFPDYKALPLINIEGLKNYPEAEAALTALSGLIDEETMRSLNRQVEVDKEKTSMVAYRFLLSQGLITEENKPLRAHPVINQFIRHLQLSLLGTLIAVFIALPLGIFITNKPQLSDFILAFAGTIQTIPSLALLGFMIPLFGIGFLPAIIALFLYALLPILRNTATGLNETDPILMEAARAMGMTNEQILIKLRLPLASSVIMAGIRTALTINIGTATLAAFIGAGGLGESIITGISLNDNQMILQGAIPAAAMALIADRLMILIERKLRNRSS